MLVSWAVVVIHTFWTTAFKPRPITLFTTARTCVSLLLYIAFCFHVKTQPTFSIWWISPITSINQHRLYIIDRLVMILLHDKIPRIILRDKMLSATWRQRRPYHTIITTVAAATTVTHSAISGENVAATVGSMHQFCGRHCRHDGIGAVAYRFRFDVVQVTVTYVHGTVVSSE